MQTIEKRTEQLAKVCKDLMLSEPFYGLFLIMLNKMWDEAVKTACVRRNGINSQIVFAPSFWDILLDPQRQGLTKHELLHIAFFHCTEFNYMTEPLIKNIAHDIHINQLIPKHNLPPGPQLPECYPELNLKLKQGSDYYYTELMKGKQNGNCPNLNAMIAANAVGNDSIVIHVSGTGDVDTMIPDHGGWDDFNDLPEATKKLIQKQIEHILEEVADQVEKSCGKVPREFVELINKIRTKEPPKFNWRQYLRMFVGGSDETFSKKSRRKLNMRYEGNPGMKYLPKAHVLVGIDTSGSVSTKELKEFLHEIYHIQKMGNEVTIAQCDTSIISLKKYNHKDENIKISGRGGTAFQPVIDYYNANLNRYSCLVYFTDGECSAPTPARGKMLWVLSSTSSPNKALVGQQIKLN